MYSKQLYTASGRIRKIILFDTKPYMLPDTPDMFKRFAEIRNTHIDLINGMHAGNGEIWFYIFYSAAKKSCRPGTYEDQAIRTKYIAVNDCIGRLYIPTRWTQNVLLVGPSQTLLYDNCHVSHALAELVAHHTAMQRAVPLYSGIEATPEYCECQEKDNKKKNDRICGGEIQVGYIEENGDKYVLNGLNTEALPQIKKKMQDLFKINPDTYYKHIQSLDNELTREYSKPFFHLDYFCMLAGRLPDRRREGVFVSVPYVFAPGMYKNKPYWQWPETQPFSEPPVPFPMNYTSDNGDPKNVQFQPIRLPMYLFPKNKSENLNPENIAFVLSYANCLVENYRRQQAKKCPHYSGEKNEEVLRPKCEICDNDRVINVYFPDYRNSMCSFIAYIYQNKEEATYYQGFFETTLANGAVIQRQPWRTKRDAFASMNRFFDRVHLYIRKELAKYGINNVYFVKHNFFDLAQNSGSLHCIAKVVERDMVN